MGGNYVYKPLEDPGNIRIVNLQPADSLTDPLVAGLEEVRLEDASYTALSYSWAMEDDKDTPGDSSPTKPLCLNVVEVLIGENLRDALRRLRDSSQMCQLWVDAVCINQRNDEEKSSQVAMMAAIYEHATLVVSWLGEGQEHVNAAANIGFQCLLAELNAKPARSRRNAFVHNWICNGRYPKKMDMGRPVLTPCPVCCRVGIAGTVLGNTSRYEALKATYRGWIIARTAGSRHDTFPRALHSAWRGWRIPGTNDRYFPPSEALLVLERRRYFRRLWVVQEAAVARRIMFQWGAYRLEGNALNLVARFVIAEQSLWKANSRSLPPSKNKVGVSHGVAELELCDWLQYCSDKDCLDPRDRLFAVFGCLNNPPSIRPDYSMSLVVVYAEFARYLLEQHDIATLFHNSPMGPRGFTPREKSPDLPTWMPDLGYRFRVAWPNKEDDAAAAWKRNIMEYTQPSLSADGLILSCCLPYIGTVDPYHGRRKKAITYTISYHAEESPVRPSSQCSSLADIDESLADTSLEEAVVDTNNKTLAVLSPECSEDVKPGDAICGSTEFGLRLILRLTSAPAQWKIVSGWHRSELRNGADHFDKRSLYLETNKIRPQQRRLYHLV